MPRWGGNQRPGGRIVAVAPCSVQMCGRRIARHDAGHPRGEGAVGWGLRIAVSDRFRGGGGTVRACGRQRAMSAKGVGGGLRVQAHRGLPPVAGAMGRASQWRGTFRATGGRRGACYIATRCFTARTCEGRFTPASCDDQLKVGGRSSGKRWGRGTCRGRPAGSGKVACALLGHVHGFDGALVRGWFCAVGWEDTMGGWMVGLVEAEGPSE